MHAITIKGGIVVDFIVDDMICFVCVCVCREKDTRPWMDKRTFMAKGAPHSSGS